MTEIAKTTDTHLTGTLANVRAYITNAGTLCRHPNTTGDLTLTDHLQAVDSLTETLDHLTAGLGAYIKVVSTDLDGGDPGKACGYFTNAARVASGLTAADGGAAGLRLHSCFLALPEQHPHREHARANLLLRALRGADAASEQLPQLLTHLHRQSAGVHQITVKALLEIYTTVGRVLLAERDLLPFLGRRIVPAVAPRVRRWLSEARSDLGDAAVHNAQVTRALGNLSGVVRDHDRSVA